MRVVSLRSLAGQVQDCSVQVRAHVEPFCHNCIDERADGRHQAGALGAHKQAKRACYGKPQHLSHTARLHIVQTGNAAGMGVSMGDYRELSWPQAAGRQRIDHRLRYWNENCPWEVLWINRVPSEKPPHVKLQIHGLGHPDGVKECGQQADLADAAQVQQDRSVADDGPARHRATLCAGRRP